MTGIEVRSRVPGVESGIPSVWLTLDDRTTCVRALIHQAVAAQVAALATAPDEGRAALDRHYAGPDGGFRRIDAATEAARACAAFEKGKFAVFVGGEQREDLDEPFALPVDGRVTFLRLTPLVGG